MTSLIAALETLGISLKLFVASVVGAFISLNFFEKREGETKWDAIRRRWVVMLCGTALGMFLTGWAMSGLEVRPENYERVEIGVGVMISLFGMAAMAEAYNAVKTVKWGEHIDAFVRKWTGRGGQ
jgi:uncharacterized protein YneF (UPF0154 family)